MLWKMAEENRYIHRNPILRRYHLKRLNTVVNKIRLAARDEDSKNSIFLDVGCGDGTYELLLKRDYGYLIGLDIALGDLRKARDHIGCRQNVELILGDIRYLPFRDLSVSVALCSEVLEHLRDPPKALLELARISSGKLLLTIPISNASRKIARILRYNRRLDEIEVTIGHVSMHGAQWWINAVDEVFGKRTLEYNVKADYLYAMTNPFTSILANAKNIVLIEMIDKALTVLEKTLSHPRFANQLMLAVSSK
jgi:ubiquinone/menaquinone biosynthesis C-methylase UbiE